MKKQKLWAPIFALLVAAMLLGACSSSSGQSSSKSPTNTISSTSQASIASQLTALEVNPSSKVQISETGSTLLYPLFNLWVPALSSKFPNISITTAGTGSGTGISQAAAGAVQIGASDAYLSPGDFQKYPGLLNIALAISAQMINYNLPGITGHLKLSGKVLSEIYQGKITTWNDPAIKALNPGINLPDIKIVPLHRIDGSGDTFIFTTYLSDADPSGWGTSIGYGTTVAFPSVPGAQGEEGNGGMVSGCAKIVGCVAYIGISYQKQTEQNNLGEAELENKAGNFVLPDTQTIQAEAASFVPKTPSSEAISLIYGSAPQGYPIINYEYAIVNRTQSSPQEAAAVKAVLAWAIDPNGGNQASFLDQVGFQPLPASVAALSLNQIQKISG
jgi:phosphate transport system substrate-binding protein